MDDLVLVNPSPTQFVKEVSPLVGHLLMPAGHSQPRLLVAPRTLLKSVVLAAREPALQSLQAFLRLVEMLWVFDPLPIGGDDKRLQPQVKPDLATWYSGSGISTSHRMEA